MIYSKLLAQQKDDEAQYGSILGSSHVKSEVQSYGTSAYSSPMSRDQVTIRVIFNYLTEKKYSLVVNNS
jgi:hypothetical protein